MTREKKSEPSPDLSARPATPEQSALTPPPPRRTDLGEPARGAPTFHNIQLLRAFAVMLVVAHHVFILLNERKIDLTHDWVGGAAGVDIFFPISGFVMVWTTFRGWGRTDGNRNFFGKRFLRIAPLYWILTTAKVALLLTAPSLALHGTMEPWHVASSYLFLPATALGAGTDNPLLPVGWTLNLEMFFYGLLALARAAGRNPLRWVVPLLLVLGLLGILHVPVWSPLRFYTNPVIIEFALGMGIARLTLHGFRLGVGVAWFGLVLALFVLVLAEYLPGFSPDWRLYVWGLPGTLLLLAMVSLEGRLQHLPFFRLAHLVGDASYAIYLSHGFVIAAIGVLCGRLGYTGLGVTCVVLALCLGLSAAAGILVHRRVELPLARALKSRQGRMFPGRLNRALPEPPVS